MKRPYNVLDLFAGAGGMALGFRAAGARCVGAVEYDQSAAATFAKTFRADEPRVFGGPEEGDVTALRVEDLLAELPASPDIVVGGPPCQGFSRIGIAKQSELSRIAKIDYALHRGKIDPKRNDLYGHFLRVVRQAKPLAFIMENVPSMREQGGFDYAKAIAREAKSAGYNVRYFLLNASNYGVPQHRWRLFFVGYNATLGHNAIPRPPTRTHDGQSALEGVSLPEDYFMVEMENIPIVASPAPHVSVREALGDLPRLTDHLRGIEPVEKPLNLRRPPSRYAQLLRDWPGHPAAGPVTGNWFRNNRRDFPIFRRMAQGDRYPEALEIAYELFNEHLRLMDSPPKPGTDDWNDLKAQYIPPYRNDAFHDKWRKLVASEPSWTVTAHLSKDTYSHIHYDSRQARAITIREAARLQSFPDSIEFEGNYGSQFKQIGNAVPPLLARAIAEQVLEQLRSLQLQRSRYRG